MLVTKQNRVIFITDADRDSGKAMIDYFTSKGSNFILNSRSNGERIQQNILDCYQLGSKVIIVNINLCKRSDIEEVLENAAKEVGTVDVLIHNQDEIIQTNIETCDEKSFLQVLDLNAKSAFFCTQVVGKQMAEKRQGKIIFLSSIHAEKPTGSSFLYSASKGAIKLLCREAALALGRHQINVNSIELGPIEGDDEKFESELSSLYDSYRYKVPKASLGSYQDAAHLAFFLSSEEAAYINGADIRLDGGFMLHYMDHKIMKPKNEIV